MSAQAPMQNIKSPEPPAESCVIRVAQIGTAFSQKKRRNLLTSYIYDSYRAAISPQEKTTQGPNS